ncbi:MAG: D-glycero-beta-D-manno-heptose-7-phosphate kinase [Kiloniellaceae bacterium]
MTDNTDLAVHVEALAKARVLVVGDVMLDRFVYGTVERISPEGPIPVLQIDRDVSMLGGAGNVLRNLAALGVRADFVAVVGEDAAGHEVRDLATGDAGRGCRILVQAGRPTTIKERYIAAGQQLLRADRESARPLAAHTAGAVVDAAKAALAESGAGALVLSDYGKGVLQPATIAALVEVARAAGRPVVVDPRGRDYARYRGAALVTPNRPELHQATGLPVDDDDQIVAACRAVIETAGVEGVLATRSEDGMTLVTAEAGAPPRHFAARAREVFDVSGAGDTVTAVVAAGLAAGVEIADAARLANVAAGIVVGKLGTAVAHSGEVLRALHASELLAAEAKVVDLDSLVERVAGWRRAGLAVGFTNGCFDLLHPGHVSLLSQARQACDRLIVGLNSDASVRRLKSRGRPVQSEAARAAVVASLADVDQVVIFGEDTPLRLIEAIRPDVLVKGADYTLDRVVGAEVVQSYGGRVVLARLMPGYSTTGTIEKLSK